MNDLLTGKPMNAAMVDLPEHQRMTLCLRYFEDLSTAQVAMSMELSVKVAGSLLGRARHQLRRRLHRWQLDRMER